MLTKLHIPSAPGQHWPQLGAQPDREVRKQGSVTTGTGISQVTTATATGELRTEMEQQRQRGEGRDDRTLEIKAQGRENTSEAWSERQSGEKRWSKKVRAALTGLAQ